MPWYVTSPEARSYIGNDTVRWKQGQPLGLRPSFPLLTITNLWAARQAVLQVDGREAGDVPYAIVGDDIVIHSKYAKAYRDNIASLGGVANVDKACSSDVQAEFCSRLIKPEVVFRLKARYLSGNDSQNILTYQGILPVKAKPWILRASKRVGSYSLVESGIIPDFHPDQPRSLREKVLMNAVLSLEQGKATREEKSFQSMWWAATEASPSCVLPRPQKRRRPTPNLLDAPREERFRKFTEWNPGIDLEQLPIQLGMVSKYYRNTWDHWKDRALMALAEDPRLKHAVPGLVWVETTHPSILREVELASAREQKVECVRTTFEYKSMKHVPDTNPDHALSHLDRKISRLEDGLVTSVGGDCAIIRTISPDVEELVEVQGSRVESTFYGRTTTSPTVEIPKESFLKPTKVSRPNASSYLQDLLRRLDADEETEISDCEQEFEL
uniref:RNA-dependent RNA polymerase n=1 Tax=Palmer virus TaxID=2707250 RepID=A0A6H0DGZ0_9VIRU|nr:MAG: RNA-dependent RNA polymerase [Palmer virus]